MVIQSMINIQWQQNGILDGTESANNFIYIYIYIFRNRVQSNWRNRTTNRNEPISSRIACRTNRIESNRFLTDLLAWFVVGMFMYLSMLCMCLCVCVFMCLCVLCVLCVCVIVVCCFCLCLILRRALPRCQGDICVYIYIYIYIYYTHVYSLYA